MLLGRVQKDNSHVIQQISRKFISMMSIIMRIQTCLVLLWVVINLIHYSVVLYYTQDVPLQQLITVIQQNSIWQLEKQSQHHAQNSEVFQNPKQEMKLCSKQLIDDSKQQNIYLDNNQKRLTLDSPNQSSNNYLIINSNTTPLCFSSEQKSFSIDSSLKKVNLNPKPLQSSEQRAFAESQMKRVNSAFSLNKSSIQYLSTNSFNSFLQKGNISAKMMTQKRKSVSKYAFNKLAEANQVQFKSEKKNSSDQRNSSILIQQPATQEQPLVKDSQFKQILSQSQVNETQENEPCCLSSLPTMFYELQVISDSIQGIFNLLQLVKINQITGHSDLSIVCLSEVAKIFAQVKNFPQLTSCHKDIGILYLKQQRFKEAISSLQRSILALFKDCGFVDMNQALFLANEGKISQYQKDALRESAKIARLMSTALKESYQLEQNINFLDQSLNIINWSIKILTSINCGTYDLNLILCLFIKAEIFFKSNNLNKSKEICEQIQKIILDIIDKISSLSQQQQQYKSEFGEVMFNKEKYVQFQQNFRLFKYISQIQIFKIILFFKINTESSFRNYSLSLKVLEQEVNLLQAQIMISQKEKFRGCEALFELLQDNQFIDEGVRYNCLMMINSVETSTPFLNPNYFSFKEELKKYDNSRIKLFLVFDFDCGMSSSLLEEYFETSQSIIDNYLNEDDSIQFYKIQEKRINSVCKSYQKKDNYYSFFCFQELQRIKNQLDNSYLEENQENLNWIEGVQELIEIAFQQSSLSFNSLDFSSFKIKSSMKSSQKFQKDEKQSNKNGEVNIYQNSIILLMTSSNTELSSNKIQQIAERMWKPFIDQFQQINEPILILKYDPLESIQCFSMPTYKQEQFYLQMTEKELRDKNVNVLLPLSQKSNFQINEEETKFSPSLTCDSNEIPLIFSQFNYPLSDCCEESINSNQTNGYFISVQQKDQLIHEIKKLRQKIPPLKQIYFQ